MHRRRRLQHHHHRQRETSVEIVEIRWLRAASRSLRVRSGSTRTSGDTNDTFSSKARRGPRYAAAREKHDQDQDARAARRSSPSPPVKPSHRQRPHCSNRRQSRRPPLGEDSIVDAPDTKRPNSPRRRTRRSVAVVCDMRNRDASEHGAHEDGQV